MVLYVDIFDDDLKVIVGKIFVILIEIKVVVLNCVFICIFYFYIYRRKRKLLVLFNVLIKY